MSDERPGMTVVYDGECPFCANYVRLTALKKQTGKVTLIDARETENPVVQTLQAKGYDLNEGMAVIYGDRIYYADDAVVLISQLTNDGGPARRVLSRLLSDPGRAKALYPWMRGGRKVALRLLGRSDIPPALV